MTDFAGACRYFFVSGSKHSSALRDEISSVRIILSNCMRHSTDDCGWPPAEVLFHARPDVLQVRLLVSLSFLLDVRKQEHCLDKSIQCAWDSVRSCLKESAGYVSCLVVAWTIWFLCFCRSNRGKWLYEALLEVIFSQWSIYKAFSCLCSPLDLFCAGKTKSQPRKQVD